MEFFYYPTINAFCRVCPFYVSQLFFSFPTVFQFSLHATHRAPVGRWQSARASISRSHEDASRNDQPSLDSRAIRRHERGRPYVYAFHVSATPPNASKSNSTPKIRVFPQILQKSIRYSEISGGVFPTDWGVPFCREHRTPIYNGNY